MKEMIAFFPKSSWMKLAAWLLIEQGLVAGSTYALIRASSMAATDAVSAYPWVIVFLFCLSTPYVPGVFARRELESSIQSAYRNYLAGIFPQDGLGIRRWARRDQRETFISSISAEALGQIRQVASTVFDLSAVLLNVVLNLAVLGYHFHPVIAAAFALGTSVAFLIFRKMLTKIDSVSEAAQVSRTALFAKIQRSWDNMFAAHGVHRRGYRASLESALSDQKAKSVGAVTLSELVSVGTTFAILAPVLIAVVALLNMNPTSGFLLSLLATLPRQFQIMGNLQVFLSYMTAFAGISAQARRVLSQSRVEDVRTEDFVSLTKLQVNARVGETESTAPIKATDLLSGSLPAQGRLVVRGPNGAGKSSLLLSLKDRLGDGAYYLPAHLDFWIDEDVRTSSSGEKILRTLQYAEAQGLPSVVLLDEWDANLDAENRARIGERLERLSEKHLVVEVRHNV